jgi:hypothetical protein
MQRWASKLPALRHPVKRRMALECPHFGRQQAEADRAAAVAVVDAVDQRRQLLAPVSVGREQVRLMEDGGNQVEQHDADGEWLAVRRSGPQLVETRQQKAGVARWVADLGGWWDETDFHIPYFTKDRMRTNCDIGISGVVCCLIRRVRGMKQLTSAAVGFERYAKTTRRAAFLAEMEEVVPWSALCALMPPARETVPKSAARSYSGKGCCAPAGSGTSNAFSEFPIAV